MDKIRFFTLCLLVLASALLFSFCASRQPISSQKLGRFVEANPEKVYNATIEVLNIRQLQIVSENQNDPTAWIIETAMKQIKTREMRDYAVSQYGYKPNYLTYIRSRYKLKIIVEPISESTCSVTINFQPQLLASGTSDYAGQWEDGKSIGVFEEDLLKSILTQTGVPNP